MYNKMYKGEGSKKFILHLVHSFLPHRVGKILSWDGDNQKCCICKKKVYSVDEAARELGDIIHKRLDDLFDELKAKNQEKYRLALSSDNSDCIICFPCYLEFKAWLELELLDGNKQFHAILDRMGKNPMKKEQKPRNNNNRKPLVKKDPKDQDKKKKYSRKDQPLKNKSFVEALKKFKVEK